MIFPHIYRAYFQCLTPLSHIFPCFYGNKEALNSLTPSESKENFFKTNLLYCKCKHSKGNSILTQPFLILYLAYSCYSGIKRPRKTIIFNCEICCTSKVLHIRLQFCRSFVCPRCALLDGL